MILASPTLFILVLSLLIIGTAASFQKMSDKQQNSFENISSSCHNFTNLFYKSLSDKISSDKNIVTSPVNLYMLLSLLSHGSLGPTLDELRSVLHHKDTDSLNEEFNSLILLLNNIKDVDLRTASAIFLQNGFPYEPEFLAVCTNIFKSFIVSVDFNDKNHSVDTINIWVQKATDSKISEVIYTDDLDENVAMILVNAIYFNGKWFNKFDEQYTSRRRFHVSKTEELVVPTMFTETKLNYGKILEWKASFIEIPYVNPDFVMVILLPDEEVDLRIVEKHFNWTTLASAPRFIESIELYLPKFKVEALLDIKNVLKKIGVNAMFSKVNANFKRFSHYPVHISHIVQKVFIEVNEEGSEAAAATVARGRKIRSAELSTVFMVNRPFLFAIEYKPSKIPLFLGSVRKLDSELQKDEL